MTIDRRELLTTGGLVLVGTSLLGSRFASRCYARVKLHGEMMEQATTLLLDKAQDEIESLPAKAREDLRTYFHGVCVNVHGFVTEICSHGFAEKLATCQSDEQKYQMLNVAFSQKVITTTELLNRVKVTAVEVGQTLDDNWKTCCREAEAAWKKTASRAHPTQTVREDLSAHVETLIRDGLDRARQAAYPIGQRPALSSTIGDIGASAILLLPVMAVAPWDGFPMFIVAALRPAWNWIAGRLANPPSTYQTAISEHLAILGNRVGSEFEQECRRRIADLHRFQELAFTEAARIQTYELIPSLI